MAEFDFDATRRWARFDPRRTLARRGDDRLPFVHASLIGGQDPQKLGLVVLTANVRDYDILLQLIPTGRALFYRRK